MLPITHAIPVPLYSPKVPSGLSCIPSAFSAYLPQAGQNEDSGAACGQIQIPVLGKMLDHLFFKLFRKEETSLISLDILCSLFTFLSK